VNEAQEYQEHVAELRSEAEEAKRHIENNPPAGYFADWLLFYMDALERSRNDHAATLHRWAESIKRRRPEEA
jgi:hypothetical protein